MKEYLHEISEIANELNGTDIDLNIKKVSIIFPFIEALGYDTTVQGDVITVPFYTPDGSYKLDYGLRGISKDSIKTVIKIIDNVNNFNKEESKIRMCLMQSSKVDYVIVTDCFGFNIYSYDSPRNQLVFMNAFNILNENSIDETMLLLLQNPCGEDEKQQEAEYEDDEYEGPRSISKYEEREEIEPVVKKKVNNKLKWGLIIASQVIVILLLLLVIIFAKSSNNEEGFLSFLNLNGQENLDYYKIKSSLDLKTNNNILEISFYSKDIPAGGVVKFDIVNGSNSITVYNEVSSSGNINKAYEIPTHWNNPSIVVTTYLNFDDPAHVQPQNVRDKFGEIGEKIIGEDNAPSRFALSYATVEYDSDAVRAYLQWLKEQEEANLRAERLADFQKFEVRYDALGNIKVLPKGYNMNTNNITGNIHIYPQIFYDVNTNFAHFYLICGQVSSVTWSMFRDISFYADGMSWNYEIGNNEKKNQVTGQYVTEWVYFDNFNIASLLSESAMLGSSDFSQVIFNGSKAATYTLNEEEKLNIRMMVALFNKYFTDSSNRPNGDWFKEPEKTSTTTSNYNPEVNSNVDGYYLGYIKTPTMILERDSAEQKNINHLESMVEKIKKEKGDFSAYETLLNEEKNKFKVLSDDMLNDLMNTILSSSGKLVYDNNYDNSEKDYYKLYFKYDGTGSIEEGFIPYVYVMEDRTVYIPVKTYNGATANDKRYASFILDKEIFNQLVDELEILNYKTIN